MKAKKTRTQKGMESEIRRVNQRFRRLKNAALAIKAHFEGCPVKPCTCGMSKLWDLALWKQE